MASKNFDVLIVGGGLSGLLLGYFLKKHRPDLTFRILEKREAYTHDRYWSFWLNRQNKFEFSNLIEKTYSSWRVNQQNVSADEYDYATIGSGGFYRFMAETLKGHIVYGAVPEEVHQSRITLDGETLVATKVFSSVPEKQKIKGGLWQKFYGWRVKTANPVFDPEKAVVMDFFCRQPGGAFGFYYVLPFSQHEALIEPTVFSRTGDEEKPYFEAARDAYLQNINAGEVRILDTEAATLPMAVLPSVHADVARPTPIGAAAGWLRPSTGYSFVTAVKLTEQIALSPTLNPPRPYSRPLLAMDDIFLTVARRHPERMPALFANWFAAPAQGGFIRFLQNENLTITDALRVIRCTPYKAAFLRAALTKPWRER